MFKGLRGKNVLITGAGTGIGADLARSFAEAGAAVGLHYRKSRAPAEALCRRIRAKGGKAECFAADLLDPAAPAFLISAFLKRFKRLDVLVNNAGGVYGAAPFEHLDADSWDNTQALNARAPFFLALRAFDAMKRRGGGKIINISSIAVKYGGSEKTVHYAAAKAALEAASAGLARFGARHGVLVNVVRAGFIDTPFHKNLNRTGIAKRISLIPLGRAGQPADVSGAVLYLASDAGNFVTGQVLTVSGGD